MTAWHDPRIARGMRLQLTQWHKRQKAGVKAIGWKAGFAAPESQEKMRLAAPLMGYLMEDAALSSNAQVSLDGWTRAGVEAEIAVFIGKDLPGGGDRDRVKAAITGIAPALELIDVNSLSEDVTEILENNLYQRHVILGHKETGRSGGRIEGLTARLTRNGQEVGTSADFEAAIGDPIETVRHLASLLSAYGERLRAGQVIITGTLLPPVWVEPGDRVEFTLEPYAPIAVRFAKQVQAVPPVAAESGPAAQPEAVPAAEATDASSSAAAAVAEEAPVDAAPLETPASAESDVEPASNADPSPQSEVESATLREPAPVQNDTQEEQPAPEAADSDTGQPSDPTAGTGTPQ